MRTQQWGERDPGQGPRRRPGPGGAWAQLLALALLAACAQSLPPTVGPGGLILQDDFSDVNSGWDRHTGVDLTTDYADGTYRIAIELTNLDAWGLAGLDLNDVEIRAEARHSAGPADNAFGLLCRYTRTGDQNNFYFFLISSDGYYAMGKVVRDVRTYLNPAQDFEPLSAIRADLSAVQELQATCAGRRLAFRVNGVAVGEVEDGDLTHGDVGLMAGTFNEGGVAIAFDNVQVRQP